MRYLFVIFLILFLTGCTTNLAWRGVVINTMQESSTDGLISNQPKHGDNSIDAGKQTDLDAKLDNIGR